MRISCTVCYELFIPTSNVHVAPCGHFLHLECWLDWLQRSANCPDCRKPTNSSQLIKLFFNISDGDDYETLTNKYDSLRCELSCKTSDCEKAEVELIKQKELNHSLRQQLEVYQGNSSNFKSQEGDAESSKVKVPMPLLTDLFKTKAEAEDTIKQYKDELTKLRTELKAKTAKPHAGPSSPPREDDFRKLREYELIVKNLSKCQDDYEELKNNSDFVKSLKVYTDLVDSSVDMRDDIDDEPEKYIELFRDVKKYLDQKERREAQLNQSPRGCVIELSGFPNGTDIKWQDIRDVIEQYDCNTAFITFNPGEKEAYVRLHERYEGQNPAHQVLQKLRGRVWIEGVVVKARVLEGEEEMRFLRRSLEDRDRKSRDRFRKRRGYDEEDDWPEDTSLLDHTMRMVTSYRNGNENVEPCAVL